MSARCNLYDKKHTLKRVVEDCADFLDQKVPLRLLIFGRNK